MVTLEILKRSAATQAVYTSILSEICLHRKVIHYGGTCTRMFIGSMALQKVQFHAAAIVPGVAHSLVGGPQLAAVKTLCLYSAFHCP